MPRLTRPDGIDRALVEQMRFERDIAHRLDDDYLAVDYRNFLYGGWRHPKGHIVTKAHEGLIQWHEANKALFCPMCRTCGLHNTLCSCPDTKVDLCRAWIGQAPVMAEAPWNGEGEEATRVCDQHGEIPWRRALYFGTLCAFPGNGWAKEVPVDTPVLTPTGWCRIGSMRVGDDVIAGDGTVTRITGVYPQGVKPVWKLTFDDGVSCRAGRDHQWRAKKPSARFRRRRAGYGDWSTLSTSDILAIDGEHPRPTRRVSIPLVGPVETLQVDLPLDPYLLGVLLGDGGLTCSVLLSSADPEILDFVRAALPDGCTLVHSDRITWRVRGGGRAGGNPVITALRRLDVFGKKSNAKRIPPAYLWAPPAVRLALLQGLMDTDGTVDKRGFVDFGTVSPGLAEDVAVLVRSLGGKSRIFGPSKRHYTKNGKRHAAQDSYEVHISPTSRWNPFRLTRKRNRVREPVYAEERVLRSVVPDGEADCVCIAVDHPQCTYVINDYIVTHNTTGGLAEFCSDIVGYRPWDGSLTAPAHNNWLWLIICQTLSVSAKLNIQPKLDQMLGSRILHRDKNSSGGIDHIWLRTLWGIDRLKVASQDQHSRTSATVSPIEGTEYAGVAVDEPPDDSIRAAYGRGLRFGLNNGWGKEQILATFFEGSVEQRAFVFDTFWNASFRRGGPDKSIFVMSGSIHENPALTPEDKRQIIAKYPPHEREARTWGFYEELAGLIFAEFKPSIHVYDNSMRDVLYDKAKPKEPSDWPIYHVVDPHDIRPWCHLWIAVGPDNEDAGLWVIDEWPRGEFERMTHYSNAQEGFNGSYGEYAAVIAEVESRFPGGGSTRVVRRFMDPGFGGSEKAGTPGKVQDALGDFGYFFETDFTRDRDARHLAVRRYLNGSWKKGQPRDNLHRPHLHVARSCRNTIRAFLSYIWDDKRGRPADIGSDHMDALGYAAVNSPQFVSVGRTANRANHRMMQLAERRRAARAGGFR